jgi:hypothetical protein
VLLSTDDNPRGCLPLWCSWRVAPLPCANRVNAFRVELYADPPGAVSPLREPSEEERQALTKAMRDLL